MLESDRLFYRPYQFDDFDFLASMYADPEVVRFIGNGQTKTKEELETLFPRWLERSQSGFGLNLIILKQTGELIGHAGIVRQEVDGVEEYEIGYWLAKRYWGRGYATEAAVTYRDYAIGQLGIKRLICIIQPGNMSSIKVAQKIGMQKEKETLFRKIPVHIYALVQELDSVGVNIRKI